MKNDRWENMKLAYSRLEEGEKLYYNEYDDMYFTEKELSLDNLLPDPDLSLEGTFKEIA
jgi:hypothetical protein